MVRPQDLGEMKLRRLFGVAFSAIVVLLSARIPAAADGFPRSAVRGDVALSAGERNEVIRQAKKVITFDVRRTAISGSWAMVRGKYWERNGDPGGVMLVRHFPFGWRPLVRRAKLTSCDFYAQHVPAETARTLFARVGADAEILSAGTCIDRGYYGDPAYKDARDDEALLRTHLHRARASAWMRIGDTYAYTIEWAPASGTMQLFQRVHGDWKLLAASARDITVREMYARFGVPEIDACALSPSYYLDVSCSDYGIR